MAIVVADTLEGRAMILSALMRREIDAKWLTARPFVDLMQERWPHYVHYRGRGAPNYCPPDTFGLWGKQGPTHCDWIVPGTL